MRPTPLGRRCTRGLQVAIRPWCADVLVMPHLSPTSLRSRARLRESGNRVGRYYTVTFPVPWRKKIPIKSLVVLVAVLRLLVAVVLVHHVVVPTPKGLTPKDPLPAWHLCRVAGICSRPHRKKDSCVSCFVVSPSCPVPFPLPPHRVSKEPLKSEFGSLWCFLHERSGISARGVVGSRRMEYCEEDQESAEGNFTECRSTTEYSDHESAKGEGEGKGRGASQELQGGAGWRREGRGRKRGRKVGPTA